jgi:stage II sporulation protein AA (anti-sigma F factor antagonist)
MRTEPVATGGKRRQRLEGRGCNSHWTVDRSASVLTIALDGEVDLACMENFEPTLDNALEEGQPAYVVLDLGGVSFIDSTGLRLILRIKHRMDDNARGSLFLSRLSKPVQRLLDVTGLANRFEYLNGEAPETFYCPMCGSQLSRAADHCSSCGGVF